MSPLKCIEILISYPVEISLVCLGQVLNPFHFHSHLYNNFQPYSITQASKPLTSPLALIVHFHFPSTSSLLPIVSSHSVSHPMLLIRKPSEQTIPIRTELETKKKGAMRPVKSLRSFIHKHEKKESNTMIKQQAI